MALDSNELRSMRARVVRVRRQWLDYQPYEVLVHLTPQVVDDLKLFLDLLDEEITRRERNA